MEFEKPEIITQTPKWLVVFKPSGMLTIAGSPKGANQPEEELPEVLADWARERVGRIWVVHRLDRETSGAIIFARTAEAHREAGIWFQKHQVKKSYDCLAQGVPASPVFRINQPVRGAHSVSQVEVREKFKVAVSGGASGAPQEIFLARVTPLTGRRHQIRIHMASQGHPLLGDSQYGGQPLVHRVALHSARIELPTREVFEASWPRDFKSWVEGFRKDSR